MTYDGLHGNVGTFMHYQTPHRKVNDFIVIESTSKKRTEKEKIGDEIRSWKMKMYHAQKRAENPKPYAEAIIKEWLKKPKYNGNLELLISKKGHKSYEELLAREEFHVRNRSKRFAVKCQKKIKEIKARDNNAQKGILDKFF